MLCPDAHTGRLLVRSETKHLEWEGNRPPFLSVSPGQACPKHPGTVLTSLPNLSTWGSRITAPPPTQAHFTEEEAR